MVLRGKPLPNNSKSGAIGRMAIHAPLFLRYATTGVFPLASFLACAKASYTRPYLEHLMVLAVYYKVRH